MFKRPRILIIALLLLFGIPLLTAFFMAKEKKTLSDHTTHHGILIVPPFDLAALPLKDKQGHALPNKAWKGKWWMLYVNNAENCDSTCDEMLYNMRQIKSATGKHSKRVERAILTFSDAAPDTHLANALNTDFSGTSHFVIAKDDLATLVQTNTPVKLALMQQNSIFIVDPLGNIIMLYQQQTPPMGILKDLEHLLKLSRIG